VASLALVITMRLFVSKLKRARSLARQSKLTHHTTPGDQYRISIFHSCRALSGSGLSLALMEGTFS